MVAIVFIGFLVLGPKDLVKYSHLIGRWLAKIRTEVNNFKILAEEEILKGEKQITEIVDEKKAIEEKITKLVDVKSEKDPEENG